MNTHSFSPIRRALARLCHDPSKGPRCHRFQPPAAGVWSIMADRRCDVLVIGCGPAGLVAAGLLARAGHRVTAIDRDRSPRRDGLVLTPPGLEVLSELGWLESLASCPDFRVTRALRVSCVGERVELATEWRTIAREQAVVAMGDGAAAAGVELLDGLTAFAPLWDGERVVGMRARDAAGAVCDLAASAVVDATGPEALIPHILGQVLPRHGPPRLRFVALSGREPDSDHDLAILERHWIQWHPVEGGVIRAVVRGELTPPSDPTDWFRGLLATVGWTGAEVVAVQGKPVSVGLNLRAYAGSGWVAVGEAGGCGGPGLPSVTSSGLAHAASAAWELDLALKAGRPVGRGELGATVTLGRQTVYLDAYLERVLARVAAVGQLSDALREARRSSGLAALLGGEWAVRSNRLRHLLMLWRLDRRARRTLRRARRVAV